MGFGDKAKLVFDIEANSGAAKREIDSLYGKINGLGGGFTAAFGGAIPMATAAAAGIAAVGTAAITAGIAVFNLTKAAADYGSAIFDATQQTGLTAETISALKYAADTSGSSLEAITGSVAKFNVLIGQANQGNEKANKTLELYGVTARDTDAALAQAIKTIAEMTSADQQAAAAKDLFRDRTAAILPVIKSFDGDLPGLMAKLRELGLLMSDEDARAADEFGDTLDTLSAQAGALGRQFATELMPMMTDAMKTVSEVMSENKGVAREWGQEVIYTVNGVSAVFNTAAKGIEIQLATISFGLLNNQQVWINWGSVLLSNLGIIGQTIQMLNLLGKATDSGQAGARVFGGLNIPDIPSISSPGGGGKGKGGGGGGKKDNTAEQLAARDLNAQIRYRQNQLNEEYKNIDKSAEALVNSLREAGTADETVKKLATFFVELERRVNSVRAKIEELENSKRATMTLEEQRLLTQEQFYRREQDRQKLAKAREDFNQSVAKVDKERSEDASNRLDIEINKTRQLLEAEQERLDILKQFPAPDSVFSSPEAFGIDMTAGIPPTDTPYNFGIAGSWDDFKESVLEDGPTVGDTLSQIGEIGANAFAQLASGIGQMVQAWVLYGTAGPQAMRKMVASVLASVAAQSAVLAIFELAKGFAALFWNPPEAAAHFKAAALFGSLAVVSGLSGRAVAGNSFNQAVGSATGGGSGAGSNSSNNDPTARQNNFTTPFAGFGREFGQLLQRNIDVMAQAEETNHMLYRKLVGVSPGEMLRLGAEEDPGVIRGAYEGELGNDSTATETFNRKTGRPF